VKVELPATVACKSMNRVQKQKHLAHANRHIAELAAQILRQRVIVKDALGTGQRSEIAESLLDALEGSLRIFEKHRIFLLSCSPANKANKEKAPAARPGLGWDLTDRTIIRARSLHNSAIFENRCIFWTTDGVICALGYNESV
jgi:hypothetical protein